MLSKILVSRRFVLAAVMALCALAGSLVFSSIPALALAKSVKVSSFTLPEEQNPKGVAVDQANGDVFVADGESVQRFNAVNRLSPSAGYSLGLPLAGSFTNAVGVAVDDSGGLSQGDVYVADAEAKVVDKYKVEGLELRPDGTLEGKALSEPRGVAVDPANGDVYVSDTANSVVDVFTPAGEFVPGSQFVTGSGPEGLAFNSSGSDLYVVAGGQVEELEAAGSPVIQTAGPNAGISNVVDGSSESPRAVTVDPVTNDVYVYQTASASVAVFESSGAPLSQQGFPAGNGFSLALALDSLSGAVYVPEFSNHVVSVYQSVVEPEAITGAASHETETSAILEGEVNPEGVAVTSCEFEYGKGSVSEHEQSCAALPGGGKGFVAVQAEVKGLQPGAVYHYRLTAVNVEGFAGKGQEREFETPSRPILGGEFVSEVGTQSATVNVHVNDQGLTGEYQVIYGTTPGSSSFTTPLLPVPSSGDVEASLGHLTQGTIYYFRVLVTDAHGTSLATTSEGGEATFTTYPSTVPALPDGRVYEMVSPPSNEEAQVYVPPADNSPNGPEFEQPLGSNLGGEPPFQVSADGSMVAYVADPTSGGNGSGGSGGGNQYLATRSPAGGWTQVNIQPPALHSPIYKAFSRDLSVGILTSGEPLFEGGPGGFGGQRGDEAEVRLGLYSRTNIDGNYHALDDYGPTYLGSSVNGSHVLFSSPEALTPEALAGQSNLYDSVSGQLHLVNVLPGNGGPVSGSAAERSGVVSADGSRIFWSGGGDLYMRENDARTVQVDTSVGGGGEFQAASADGSRVFFTKSGELYEYDVESEQNSELASNVQSVIGVSEDGAYVYFVDNSDGLSVRHEEVTRHIATLAPADNEIPGIATPAAFGDWHEPGRRTAEVAAGGHGIAFLSHANLTAYNHQILNPSDNKLESVPEVYVYNADADQGKGELFCASCNPSGEPPPILLGGQKVAAAGVPVSNDNTVQPGIISAEGGHVFFNSEAALVPQDTNGYQDVYEWEMDGVGGCERSGGCISLLSGGTSNDVSYLIGASTSGSDVFMVTRQRLVPQDQNDNFNLFDARAGAPAAITSPECSGSGCQGVPPAPPIFATPSSVTFDGVGNFPPPPPTKPVVKPKPKPKKCKKGYVKKKAKCVKKPKPKKAKRSDRRSK